ncbi:MAG: aldehyde dehydrogenase family protein [Acidimicrobiales bacterium]
MSERLDVRKTYKLVIGGAFVRSESGRAYAVTDAGGAFLANAARASRKDVRDAVRAAQGAQPGWAAHGALLRGQVLYRLAEMAEARAAELADHVARAEGVDASGARASVARGIDRLVWYAGWADKVGQVLGGANDVAGPYFNFSVPVPVGVVGVVAPADSSFEGLVDTLVAPLVTGNAVVVLASERRPVPAVLVGEMSATADLPAGLVNVLTGHLDELGPVLAAHEAVDGLDLTGATDPAALAALAADSLTRVLHVGPPATPEGGLRRLRAFVDTTTVWHTVGM